MNIFTPEEFKKLLKFSVTGVLNTLVDFGTFFILTDLTGRNPYLSQFLAYSLATLNSYLVNRKWTFKKGGAFKGDEFSRFTAVNLCSLLLSLLGLRFFYGVMNLPKPAAKIFTLGLTMPVNYLGSRFWAFKEEKETGAA